MERWRNRKQFWRNWRRWWWRNRHSQRHFGNKCGADVTCRNVDNICCSWLYCWQLGCRCWRWCSLRRDIFGNGSYLNNFFVCEGRTRSGIFNSEWCSHSQPHHCKPRSTSGSCWRWWWYWPQRACGRCRWWADWRRRWKLELSFTMCWPRRFANIRQCIGCWR